MNEFLSKAHALKSERANKRFQPTASLACARFAAAEARARWAALRKRIGPAESSGLSQMKLKSHHFENYPISGNQKPLRAFFTHIWGYFVQCDYTLLRMTDHYRRL
jgi:hypothetical protein